MNPSALRRAAPVVIKHGVVRLVLFALMVYLLFYVVRSVFREPQVRRRPGAAGGSPGDERSGTRMSRREALEVLGVQEGASREELVSAYRTLIRKVHPDSPGGSTYLASKVNEAKDVLLG